ncbi:hypothetical protein K439DRAFT_1001527 [Ramaria rubella]|nr:hypothetical protein K439DRAFT_1001527 [Ramaria rubella]
MDACNKRCGIKKDGSTTIGAQPTMHEAVSKYSPYRHRALIALRCAKDHRPFECVKDEFYLAEVELLRPGTKVPDPKQSLVMSTSSMLKSPGRSRCISRHTTGKYIWSWMDGQPLCTSHTSG